MNENEARPLMNYEIDKMLQKRNIVRVSAIKATRIRWYGHT